MDFKLSRNSAIANLENFINQNLSNYSKLRNFDLGPNKRSNVSCLSPYLTHGIISETEIISKCLKNIHLLKLKSLFKRFFGEFIGKVGWNLDLMFGQIIF